MSLEAVARKDFEDAVRSRWLLALSAVFVLLVSAVVYLVRPGEGQTLTTGQLLGSLYIRDALVTTLVPLIALIVAYGAVVGERASGSLKLLLSLPHSRADVVFGKLVGRTAAIAVPIAVGFVLPAFIAAVGPLRLQVGVFVGYVLLTVLLAAAFVAIAVGFSAAVASNRLAIGGAIGLFFLFVPLWGAVQFPLRLYFVVGGAPGWLPISGQQLFAALRLINPTGSFKIIAGEFVSGALFAGGSGEFGLSMEVAAFAMLVAWLLVPPLLGLWRFERADL
ncbi:ABC transporter permease subunit [Candidatus Halobonum tyrrellensis]|uniref:ABC transporter n=1 Tax=Candidatus Halobonum tyrrellensis G22 TaxID=1324957 RepID=V4HII3_9EURY|nr:ABC transporter permease subunit [Candidatus Halobonum tyrrellensis]ESP89588.1 ABC transporter [Candidatus Halobonum tyrrellensis G22]